MAASFLDDIGDGMKDAALATELGLSAEQGEALFAKCKTGNMNFVDFVTVTRFLDHMGGDGGMVPTLAQFPDALGSSDMAMRIQEYQEILGAMEPGERGEPALLLGPDAAARQRVARLAEASGRTEAAIDQFLLEYRTMQSLLADLGTGRSMDQATLNLAASRAEQEAAGKSRKIRRKVQSRGRRKQPEWMNM